MVEDSGSIFGLASARANLAVSIGKMNGVNFGNMVFDDPSAHVQMKVTAITKYEIVAANQRHIEGMATVNGNANVGFILDVVDNGTPDTNDMVTLKLATGYNLSARLNLGTLRIQKPCN